MVQATKMKIVKGQKFSNNKEPFY